MWRSALVSARAMRHNVAGLPETMMSASESWSWQQHPLMSPVDMGETSPRLLAVKGRRAGLKPARRTGHRWRWLGPRQRWQHRLRFEEEWCPASKPREFLAGVSTLARVLPTRLSARCGHRCEPVKMQADKTVPSVRLKGRTGSMAGLPQGRPETNLKDGMWSQILDD